MVAIAAPPAGSRNVDRGTNSEAEGLRGGGQLSADHGLLRAAGYSSTRQDPFFTALAVKIRIPRFVQKTAVAVKAVRKFRRSLARYERPKRRGEMTATLQRMVRDPRTGEVHMPHEPLSIIRTMENLGRT
jgi:ribosomal protein L32